VEEQIRRFVSGKRAKRAIFCAVMLSILFSPAIFLQKRPADPPSRTLLLGLLLPPLFRGGRGFNSADADSLICQYAASEQAFENGLLVGREVFGVANRGQVLNFTIAAMAAMVSFAAGAVRRRCPAAPGALVALMQARLLPLRRLSPWHK
jgi:hypothetical protein